MKPRVTKGNGNTLDGAILGTETAMKQALWLPTA